jgi:nucleoside-diphosphate-sugar epimerase
MNKILVTGGLGFIGSHTVDLLVKRRYSVRVVNNLQRHAHWPISKSWSLTVFFQINLQVHRNMHFSIFIV